MSVSFISADLVVEGDIASKGEVSIEGNVTGNISCKNLIIKKGGLVRGNISSEEFSTEGSLEGNITSKTVLLKEGSSSKTKLECDNLEILNGAKIRGTVKTSEWVHVDNLIIIGWKLLRFATFVAIKSISAFVHLKAPAI